MKERLLREEIERLNKELRILRKYVFHLQQVVIELTTSDIEFEGDDNED